MESQGLVVGIQLFVAGVMAAALVGLVARRVALPYTVGLVLIGLLAGVLLPDQRVTITPQLVLTVLLPGLVFEAAYRIEIEPLRRTFRGIALLAAPGVVLTAIVVAIGLHLSMGLRLDLGFVVGAMVAATDPAAVIATFRRIGAPRALATLVDGESLFNDGTSLVVFSIAVRAIVQPVSAADAVIAFVVAVAGGALLGAFAGYLASRVIATVDDHLIELTISLALAYGTYLIADALHESGVIATVVAGVVLGNYGRRIGMSERTQEALDTVWEFAAFLLTALAFLLVGLVITLPRLLDALPWIAWGIAAVLVGRAIVIYGMLGTASRLLRRSRYARLPIPTPWLHVLFWAGLRGAVAVAMALSLPLDIPQRDLLQEITFGIVLFTLLAQGTTIELVMSRTRAADARWGPPPAKEPSREPAA